MNACHVQTPGVICLGMVKNARPRTQAILSMLIQMLSVRHGVYCSGQRSTRGSTQRPCIGALQLEKVIGPLYVRS